MTDDDKGEKKDALNPILWLLLGKWLGHPLHPAIVHIPIALWTTALLFDILTWSGLGGNALVRTSFWAILGGLVSLAIVVPAGVAEWTQIKREKPAWKLALWHAILNVTAAGLFLASLLLRVGSAYDAVHTPGGALWLCAFGTLVLGVSGYLGGRMVYEHGIGVARESKKRWREIATAGGANLPEPK